MRDRPDLRQHAQHGLVRPAVEAPVERRARAGERRERVGLRAPDRAHGIGRAVLLVVGVQDEEHVEGALEERVGPVLELGHLEHHREEVPRVGEVVVRVDVRLAERVTVGEGGDGRHLGEQAVRLHAPRLGIVDAPRVGVEGRERAHGGDQHAHRVRVVAEPVHELLDVLVHDGVHGDVVRPLRQVVGGGELALDQEVGGLQERALLGELLDRVAAVEEHARVAVDVGDAAGARGGVREGGVVGDEPQRAQVGGTDRAVLDRDLVPPPGAVVGDGERLLRHGHLPWRGSPLRARRQVRSSLQFGGGLLPGGMPPRAWLALLVALLGSRAALAVQLEVLEPGREWRLRALVFRGNHALGTGELRRALVTAERPWYQRWRVWRPAPEFDPVTFRADLEHLRRLYRSRGYYHARVAHDLELAAGGDALTAVVYIDEGPPVVVEDVAVSLGGTALEPAERERLLGALPIARGQVLGADAYERAVAYLRAYYRERGFARVRVRRRAQVDVRHDRARVAYEVASGPPSVFGEVRVTGTRAVDPAVVRRELAFRPGEPFKASLVERTRANLMALRLFRTIRIDEDKRRDPRVEVRIRLIEAPRHEVRCGGD